MASPIAEPLFSIIIPTLDVESTIAACLDSIARQTCHDYEVVLVDGASKDKTVPMVADLEPQFAGRL